MDKTYMNIKEVAVYLSLPVSSIYAMTAKNEIPFIRLPGGRLMRFIKTDIDLWIESKKEVNNER